MTMPATPTPQPEPAAAPKSKPPPAPPKTTAQVVGETIVDLVAIVGTIALSYTGKVGGEFALALVALLAGVRVSDLVTARSGGGGGPGPGAAAGGLAGLVMLLGHATHRAQPGYLRVPGWFRRGLRATQHVGVAARAAWSMLRALVVATMLTGCPGWVRPECATPGRYECRANQPHYCGTSRALTPIGDVPCGAGETCGLDDAGVAHCARAVDGGAK